MKASAVAAIALGASLAGGPALAADMPVKAPVEAAAPAYRWSGLYAGVSAGGRWADTSWTTDCVVGVAGCGGAALGVHNPVGFDSATARFGGYLGFNWQVSPSWLVGVEGDAAWGHARASTVGIPGTIAAAAALAATGDTAEVKQGWDGSVRGRLGYLVGPTWLVYASGGVAWQQVDLTARCTGVVSASQCGVGVSAAETSSTTRTGWTVGGGIEGAFGDRWLGRVEYRYADYGTISHTFFSGTPGVIAFSMSEPLRTHTVLVGLAYKLGPP